MSKQEFDTGRWSQGVCYDCGRKYGDEFGFPDLLVPTGVWREIGPTGGEGGLLCPSCIVRRCVLRGIECEARWASGPFSDVEHERHGYEGWADFMERQLEEKENELDKDED